MLDFATLPCLESRSLSIPLSSKLWKIVVAHTICISHGCSSNFQTIRAPCRKYGRGKLIPVFNPTHQHQTSILEHRFSNIRKWRRLAPWRCSLNNRCHAICLWSFCLSPKLSSLDLLSTSLGVKHGLASLIFFASGVECSC